MSHIHLPDGFLPLWLWLGGYALTALLITVIFHFRRRETETRRFALLGIFAALMLLVMSIELPPYHATLSVVTGIVLGGPLAILAAFVVNLMLGLAGHGGITMVGLNTLPMVVEILAGYGIFLGLRRVRLPLFGAGMLAVFFALALGTATSFGLIALGTTSINQQFRATTHESADQHLEAHAGHQHEHEKEGVIEQAAKGGRLNLSVLAVLMFGFGFPGWLLEGLLSAAILLMLQRTYPSLLPGQQRRRVEEPHE